MIPMVFRYTPPAPRPNISGIIYDGTKYGNFVDCDIFVPVGLGSATTPTHGSHLGHMNYIINLEWLKAVK